MDFCGGFGGPRLVKRRGGSAFALLGCGKCIGLKRSDPASRIQDSRNANYQGL